jgi:biopolymer transport protein ExbB
MKNKMKKVLLGLLCLTFMFSCGEAETWYEKVAGGNDNDQTEETTEEVTEEVVSEELWVDDFEEAAEETTEEVTEEAAAEETTEEGTEEAAAEETTEEGTEESSTDGTTGTSGNEDESFQQIIKQKFMEGGPMFMGIVLLVLILGLALVIERIFYLNLATTNSKKLLSEVENSLNSGGVDAAKEVCRSRRGPIASIFYQGLERSSEGIDQVEKSIVAYGGVQMGLLEKGLSWISLCIALAPMLGFMGTVIGMIGAFDAIEAAGDISPSLVAGGIKVALLTTVFGLIVAMILQIFYNYLIAKVDSITNSMEDASISLIDLLVKNK